MWVYGKIEKWSQYISRMNFIELDNHCIVVGRTYFNL